MGTSLGRASFGDFASWSRSGSSDARLGGLSLWSSQNHGVSQSSSKVRNRTFRISHMRNRTLRISKVRNRTFRISQPGHYAARHSRRVSGGAKSQWSRLGANFLDRGGSWVVTHAFREYQEYRFEDPCAADADGHTGDTHTHRRRHTRGSVRNEAEHVAGTSARTGVCPGRYNAQCRCGGRRG
jgi:hypothetical protein